MSLPTRLKLDIRDHWANETCDLQRAFRQIRQAVGCRVDCAPDWPILWTELKPFFPEASTFIPNAASIVTIWCNSFCEFLQDEDKEQEWTEQVENALSKAGSLMINLEVGRKDVLSTRWSEVEEAFIISMPRTGPTLSSDISTSLRPDILACFTAQQTDPIDDISIEPAPEDSWANIEVDTKTGRTSMQEGQNRALRSNPAKPLSTTLPEIHIMERPEYLMMKPPYHLTISSFHSSIVVQCSHPPTVLVLEKYLKKWTKREMNHRNRLPAALMTLKESPFGLGASYNTLEIRLQENSSYALAPTFIVSFVQSMLGYVLTREENSCWALKRDTAFRAT